jgi:hypothetical protein
MPNLLPPRPGGTLAALAACPDADVIFVAHAGLDNIVSVSDVWRNFPIDQVIKARWWRVPHDQVPRDATHEAQVKWLYDWWKRIDSWITQNRPGEAMVPQAVAEPKSDTAEPVAELAVSSAERTEPYQSRHYAVVRWFLDVLFDAAGPRPGPDRRPAPPRPGGHLRPSRPARTPT